MFAAFTFPPIDELFRWKDIGFNGTNYAINKTSLLVFVSSMLIIVLFVGGSRSIGSPGWAFGTTPARVVTEFLEGSPANA